MNTIAIDILRQFWPVWLLAAGGLLMMFLAFLKAIIRIEVCGYLTTALFLGALFGFAGHLTNFTQANTSFLIVDPYGSFLAIIICLVGAVISMLAISYFKRQEERIGEIFSLLLFSAVGMCLMVMTTHLLTLFIALEVMSLSLYVLVGVQRQVFISSEAALKYFILGSAASSFLLLGIALFYGATNSLSVQGTLGVTLVKPFDLFLKLGIVLLILGFAFKVGSVPFHFWTPDVYAGAPYPITGFMATGVKVAAFGALLRVLQYTFNLFPVPSIRLVTLLSLATMIVGNLAALRQTNLKRILAYSSIGHAGYLLLGVVAYLSQLQGQVAGDVGPMLFYLLTYSLMTLGAFAILSTLAKGSEEAVEINDLAGLASRKPLVAALLAIFLFSLAGLPPTVGFMGKFYLFKQAVMMGHVPLVVVAVLTSAISFYYYVAPIVAMYFKTGDKVTITWINPLALTLVAMLALSILYLGIKPSQYLVLTNMAFMATNL